MSCAPELRSSNDSIGKKRTARDADLEDDASILKASKLLAGIHAKNTIAAKFELVSKPEYNIVEKALDLFEPDDSLVAVCDLRQILSDDPHVRKKAVTRLGDSLKTIGFAVLTGHGVEQALHDQASCEVQRLFVDHTLDVKRRFNAKRKGSVNQGYFGVQETSGIQPDLVEGWVFCRRAFALDSQSPLMTDFWPDASHEAFWRDFATAHIPLVLPLARAILEYLGAPLDHLDKELTHPAFGLRLNYYPPLHGDDPRGAGRLLGHEVMDFFTLLPRPSQDGLQVLNRATGRWIRLRPPVGSIVLNTGDYLQRISNDVLPSTTHRVAAPAVNDPIANVARTSSPINVYIRENDVLSVLPGLAIPKYADISAIDFHTGVMSKYYGADYRQTNGED